MNVSIRKINAICGMKFKSICKNLSIMMAPILAIVIVLIFRAIIPVSNLGFMSKSAYLLSFGLFFNCVMGAIMMSSYPIAEEKEKNTLRVLLTSSVNGIEYFVGSAVPVLGILTVVNIVMVPLSNISFSKINLAFYLLVTIVAVIIGILLGFLVGIYSKNQMQSGLLSTPIMLILMFTSLLSMLSDKLEMINSYTYAGVFGKYIASIDKSSIDWDLRSTIVMAVWLIVLVILFLYAYKKHGLD